MPIDYNKLIQAGVEDPSFTKSYDSAQKSQQELAKGEELQKRALALQKLLGSKTSIHLGAAGDIGITPEKEDPESALRRQALQEERDRRAVQDLEDRATKAGTAPMMSAMQRVENAAPGALTNPSNFQPKSVGGLKNLAPNWAVSPLESIGIMPQGAARERAAFQELANVKIYDSSGKQINEQEMKRIQDALGMRGISDPQAIIDALEQMGATVVSKTNQVAAGATPKALQTFKSRGGITGAKNLSELLGKQAPASAETPEEELARLRAKHGK